MMTMKAETINKLAREIGRGRDHVCLVGPPGSSKTMIARRVGEHLKIPDDLADRMRMERIMSHVYRGAGLVGDGRKAPSLLNRPFRAPHHTVSDVGLAGGRPDPDSALPRYGEMSLAHGGVLFLDELPEFRRSALEQVSHVLLNRKVVFGTKTGTVSYPARFRLVAAMNPCPCGYSGSPQRICRCTPQQIVAYRRRLEETLLRMRVIDLRCHLSGAAEPVAQETEAQ